MAYPTNAQIDAAVPVDGTPSRALTNAVLRALAAGPAASNITDASEVGRSVLTAADAAAARTAIGAGTSSLTVGTTATTAKAGNYQPTAADISDATATGRSVLTATDAAAARTAIGAGTSSLAIGTTATTAAAGNHVHGAATGSAAGFMSAADKAKLDSLTPQAAPTIAVSDPADAANLQEQFDALVNALKAAGVLTD